MKTVFFSFLDRSLTAAWIVLAVILLRLVFRKAPKRYSCLLWAIAAVRLIFPFSVQSIVSLIPRKGSVREALTPVSDVIGIPLPVEINVPIPTDPVSPVPQTPAAPSVSVSEIAAWVWAVGAALMLLYMAASYLRLRMRMRERVPMENAKSVFFCDRADTPFILGIFRPIIYLPSGAEEPELSYILAHERAHIRRGDHFWKPLGFLLLSLYWFNPVLWAGYILFCRDIELACDEHVLEAYGTDAKKPYSEALLSYSLPRNAVTACPLAFGETGVKARIRSVLDYKKPALWIIVLTLVLCTVAAVCFLTDPKDKKEGTFTEGKEISHTSEAEGVSLSLADILIENGKVSLKVVFINETDEDWNFGEVFTVSRLENGEWEPLPIYENTEFSLPAYLIPPKNAGFLHSGPVQHTYSLSSYYPVSEKGTYRFETTVFHDGTKKNVCIEFEKEETPLPARVFDPMDRTICTVTKVLWQAVDRNSIVSPKSCPAYRISGGTLYWDKGTDGLAGDGTWYRLGVCEPYMPDTKALASVFCQTVPDTDAARLALAKRFLENTEHAWKVSFRMGQDKEFDCFLLLFLQKDGTMLFLRGSVWNNAEHIEWVEEADVLPTEEYFRTPDPWDTDEPTKFAFRSLNNRLLSISSVQHLSLIRFSDRGEFDAFLSEFPMLSREAAEGGFSLHAAEETYDAAFFEKNVLFCIFTGRYPCRAEQVRIIDGSLLISVLSSAPEKEEQGKCYGRLLLLPVPKEELGSVTEFDSVFGIYE